jgi:hypothetical protein
MEFEVITRSKYKDAIEKSARFYAKKLNILKSNYKVVIYTDVEIKSEGANGFALKTGKNSAQLGLYSRLPILQMLLTLAHEMVHIKQFVRGHYKSEKSRNGKFKKFWLGEQVLAKYEKQPWEVEAYKKQGILLDCLLTTISRKIKRSQK